jgi:hypothetical protein
MPPKKAPAGGVDMHFMYVCLRIMIAKTEQVLCPRPLPHVTTNAPQKPNWDLVAEAMGGEAKAHTMYCRYNTLCKKPPVPEDANLPDLESLIARAQAAGTLGKKRGGGVKVPATPKANKRTDDMPLTPKSNNKRKAPTSPKGAKAAKVARMEVPEVEQEFDFEAAMVAGAEELVEQGPTESYEDFYQQIIKQEPESEEE